MNVKTQELASLLGFDFPCSIDATQSSTTPYANNLAYQSLWYIKSNYVVDLNPVDGIFLDIIELRTMFNECMPSGSPYGGKDKNMSGVTASRSFGMIPMDVSSGGIKRFKEASDYNITINYPYPIQKLDRLNVNWVDKNGNLVHFNGAEDNAIMLKFHTLRKNLC
jgi:hypothetical protein